MSTQPDPPVDRVREGGADIMSIAEASVLLVVDEITEAVPWALPV